MDLVKSCTDDHCTCTDDELAYLACACSVRLDLLDSCTYRLLAPHLWILILCCSSCPIRQCRTGEGASRWRRRVGAWHGREQRGRDGWRDGVWPLAARLLGDSTLRRSLLIAPRTGSHASQWRRRQSKIFASLRRLCFPSGLDPANPSAWKGSIDKQMKHLCGKSLFFRNKTINVAF
jgi:hypothetical protein